MKEKSWYAVQVVYKCIINGDPDPKKVDEFFDSSETTIFEEIIQIVQASSPEDACKQVEKISKENEMNYSNMYDQKVEWIFFGCINYFQFSCSEEAYSRFLDEPKSLSDIISGNPMYLKKELG